MKLLVDIGNTNIKWSIYSGTCLTQVFSIKHARQFTDVLQREWSGLSTPESILIANVTGKAVERQINDFAKDQWLLQPHYVQSTKSAYGVFNAYAEPERLGVDRWLALVASHHQNRGLQLIVDSGTATTFDVIDAFGKHHGGLILPGLDLMRDSLLRDTSIPKVDAIKTDQLLAVDTVEAIAAAAVQSTIGLIERLLKTLSGQFGERPGLMMTGGNASQLQSSYDAKLILEPDLVLKGLAVVADQGSQL